jgi:hypothetical protein
VLPPLVACTTGSALISDAAMSCASCAALGTAGLPCAAPPQLRYAPISPDNRL